MSTVDPRLRVIVLLAPLGLIVPLTPALCVVCVCSQCTAPAGDGLGKLLTVRAGGQPSNTRQFGYNRPTLLAVAPLTADT